MTQGRSLQVVEHRIPSEHHCAFRSRLFLPVSGPKGLAALERGAQFLLVSL